ncbi:polymer-forming cytoskeletal protein [Alkalicella caledoniensis]|uniref:Polymer-forming cytoskeletal protein n=1 Tax=Alkalicella caledoniensis TaxID=2731377 RepID=A0A7G9W8K4_ALKCA|nr:polymer-forming cytoskeletal protein [Alkalicella caledoniensis]QNO15016.1 polymer-forming cytoskeletal protein [Alkalicella caledoniensis]
MFKKKEELDFANVDTIIGKDTEFSGTINGKGILRVDGKVTGEIITGDVLVGETGVVEANIKARHVTVSGTIKGNIEASGLLELMPSARLTGDIKVSNLSIGDGAYFKGACEMLSGDKSKENKGQEKK